VEGSPQMVAFKELRLLGLRRSCCVWKGSMRKSSAESSSGRRSGLSVDLGNWRFGFESSIREIELKS
jgi:hypothetical protein